MWSQINILFMVALAFSSWILLCYFQYVEDKRYDKHFDFGNSTEKFISVPDQETENHCKEMKQEGFIKITLAKSMSMPVSSLRGKLMGRHRSANDTNSLDVKRREIKNISPFMCYAGIYIILFLCSDACEQLSKGEAKVFKTITITDGLETDDPVLLAIQRRHAEILAARISYLKQENVRLEQELQEIAEVNNMLSRRLENFNIQKLEHKQHLIEGERNEFNSLPQQDVNVDITKFQSIMNPNIIYEESEVLDTSITFFDNPPNSMGTIIDDSESDNNCDELFIIDAPGKLPTIVTTKLQNIPVKVQKKKDDATLNMKAKSGCSNIPNSSKKRANNCDESKADGPNINFDTPTIFLSREEYYWNREYIFNGNQYTDGNTHTDSYCSTNDDGNSRYTHQSENESRQETPDAEDTEELIENPTQNIEETSLDPYQEDYPKETNASELSRSFIDVDDENIDEEKIPTPTHSDVISSSDDDDASNSYSRNFTSFTETQIYTKTQVVVPIRKQGTSDGKTEWQWVDPESTESIIKLAKQLQGMSE